MEELFKRFSEQVKTREDLIVLIDEIEEAARLAYVGEPGVSLSEKLAGMSGGAAEKFRKTIESLETEGKFPANRRDQNTFFNELKKYLSSLSVVRLVLAFTPREEFLEHLSDYFEKATGKKIVLDVLVKEGAVAGCLVEYEGEYRDYSMAKKLEEVLAGCSRKVN
jgi:hypothetical protein